MNVLEKILEEVKEIEKKFVVGHEVLFALGAAGMVTEIEDIIRSHMDEVADDSWIPVSERLPEKPKYIYDSYIVQQDGAVEPFSAYWDGEKWTDIDDYEVKGVIAWQPLPEAYKGGAREKGVNENGI